MYSFDESDEPDPDLKRFSIDHDKAYILPIIDPLHFFPDCSSSELLSRRISSRLLDSNRNMCRAVIMPSVVPPVRAQHPSRLLQATVERSHPIFSRSLPQGSRCIHRRVSTIQTDPDVLSSNSRAGANFRRGRCRTGSAEKAVRPIFTGPPCNVRRWSAARKVNLSTAPDARGTRLLKRARDDSNLE